MFNPKQRPCGYTYFQKKLAVVIKCKYKNSHKFLLYELETYSCLVYRYLTATNLTCNKFKQGNVKC